MRRSKGLIAFVVLAIVSVLMVLRAQAQEESLRNGGAGYPGKAEVGVETATESRKVLSENEEVRKTSIIKETLLLDSIPPIPQNRKKTFFSGDKIYVWVESRVLDRPHKLQIVWVGPYRKEVKRETFGLQGLGMREAAVSKLQTNPRTTQGRWQIDVIIDGGVDRTIYTDIKP